MCHCALTSYQQLDQTACHLCSGLRLRTHQSAANHRTEKKGRSVPNKFSPDSASKPGVAKCIRNESSPPVSRLCSTMCAKEFTRKKQVVSKPSLQRSQRSPGSPSEMEGSLVRSSRFSAYSKRAARCVRAIRQWSTGSKKSQICKLFP